MPTSNKDAMKERNPQISYVSHGYFKEYSDTNVLKKSGVRLPSRL